MSDTTIEVVFLNVEDGQRIAGGNIPVSQLPETFAKNTVMHIGEQPWQVIQAVPVTAEEFKKTGKLTLTCALVEYVSPEGVLYSLPTIYESAPETGDIAPEQNVFTLHEDDWRQMEFISSEYSDTIGIELRSIMAIYQQHQKQGGFSQLHVRKAIPRPLNVSITLEKLKQYLPADYLTAAAVVFAQDEHEIKDVFAYNLSPLVIYGHLTPASTIDVLGIQFVDIPTNTLPYVIDGIVNFMKDHNLVFVDWIRMQILPPDTQGFQTYFSKFD